MAVAYEISTATPIWRRPGCSDACREVRGCVLHDPATHEAYGRVLAQLEGQQSQVVTGPLRVDFDTTVVTVAGAPVALTPTERRMVLFWASRLGRLCTGNETLLAVWGPNYVPEHGWLYARSVEAHLLRVHLARLRLKLGPAGRLVETVSGIGHVLRAEAPS